MRAGTRQTTTPEDHADDLDLARLLQLAAGLFTAGAGLIHLDAAGDHPAHAHVAAFFVVLGVAQLAWGGLIALRPSAAVVRAGLVVTALALGTWVLSRTIGIPLVAGVDTREAVGVKDAMAVLLEVLTLGALALRAVLPAQAASAALPRRERVLGSALAATLALTVPGVLAGHGHGPAHGPHGDTEEVAAGAHGDDDTSADHSDHEDDAEDGDGADGGGDDHEHGVAAAASSLPNGHAHGDGAAAAIGESSSHADHAVDDGGGHDASGHTDDEQAHAAPDGGSGDDFLPEPHGTPATLRYGPFTIPPGGTQDAQHDTPTGSNVVMTELPKPCSNCWITWMEPELVYADGSEANLDTGAMLHHNVLFESWHDDLTCARDSAIGFLGRRFFASGNERTGAGFPKDYGLWIDNTPWSGIFEIMNHRDVPQTVYFQLHVRYLSGSETLKRLTPVWLDVDNCEDSQYAIKAGTTEQAWDWTSSITGRVITTVGHVHDTGVAITLSNGSTGENMCRSVAGYGADPSYMGAIESMSLCSWDRLGTVRQGEKLRITARYQATEAHDDVMGIMMAYVYETKDLSGGTQAPPEMANPPMEAPPAEDDHDH